MNTIKCPHCGTEYEVEKQDMYHYTTCEACGKGFVIGATTSVLSSGEIPQKTEAPARLPKGRFAPRHSQVSEQRAGNAALPGRFAPPTKSGKLSSASMSNVKPGLGKKVLVVATWFLGVLMVASAFALGGYLYFGDAPRLKRGIANYDKGIFQKAYKILLPLAKKGYPDAQLIIGDCFSNGQGVFMDTEEAVKWYRLAADQDLPEASHRMFECCRDGVGIERNPANAAKWCRKAADAGFEKAMFDMAILYVEGRGVDQNEKSAFKWFRKGAERGHPMSLYKFGQCYKLGFGIEKDEDEASKWQSKAVSAWRQMANDGDTSAMIQLATLYKEGDVVELDKEEAVKWYRKGAELDDETAQLELATCYHEGEGVEEDQEEAAKWMLKAAEKGTRSAVQWAMGRFYQEGWGVEKSPVEAVKWFERAAKKGSLRAKFDLAMCYMFGLGVRKDETMAEEILEDAALAGDEDAKKELDKIKRERAEMQRRLAEEKAKKASQIMVLSKLEDIINERKRRINDILKGSIEDDWVGFDAGKVTMTDASVSVAVELPMKSIAENMTDKDQMEKINNAIQTAQKECDRLEDRIKELARVKVAYDAKELESRKETCALCNGSGTIVCARCNGRGEVVVKESTPCPRCGNDDDEPGFMMSVSRGKGQVREAVNCSYCRGTGQIRPKCLTCKGKGKVRISNGGAKLDSIERCSECNGSGFGYREQCPKCDGEKKIYVLKTCATCHGRGNVMNGSKVICSTCAGKCKLTCERCNGRGFTYRPKQPQPALERQGDAGKSKLSDTKTTNVVDSKVHRLSALRKKAEGGDAEAQFQLGLCYAKGDGVENDVREMVKWYRSAAEQGLAKAQSILSICYEAGQGVEKNEAEAIKWLRRAAEQGDADAQLDLALRYASGKGVEADDDEADKWFSRSMESKEPQRK